MFERFDHVFNVTPKVTGVSGVFILYSERHNHLPQAQPNSIKKGCNEARLNSLQTEPLGGSVNYIVCARHGHDLMGCKSPVYKPC